MNRLGYEKIKVVLDRGFFSAANINDLYGQHLKFLIAAKLSLNLLKTHLNEVRETMRAFTCYSQTHHLYAHTVPITWDYRQDRPYKGDTLKGERRMYLHLYFSPERALEEEKSLIGRLVAWQDELENDRRQPDHEKYYAKYFDTKVTPVRGAKVCVREDVLEEAKRNYGYFALVSNEIKEAINALDIYRNKDLVEKAFGNLKERLNLRRVAVSSEQSLDGKLFVEFIALIFLSYITKNMQENNLFKDYTLQEVLDELDVIECFELPGKKLQVGEMTKKQFGLYEKFGVMPPYSLQ
jgi:transposase